MLAHRQVQIRHYFFSQIILVYYRFWRHFQLSGDILPNGGRELIVLYRSFEPEWKHRSVTVGSRGQSRPHKHCRVYSFTRSKSSQSSALGSASLHNILCYFVTRVDRFEFGVLTKTLCCCFAIWLPYELRYNAVFAIVKHALYYWLIHEHIEWKICMCTRKRASMILVASIQFTRYKFIFTEYNVTILVLWIQSHVPDNGITWENVAASWQIIES